MGPKSPLYLWYQMTQLRVQVDLAAFGHLGKCPLQVISVALV